VHVAPACAGSGEGSEHLGLNELGLDRTGKIPIKTILLTGLEAIIFERLHLTLGYSNDSRNKLTSALM